VGFAFDGDADRCLCVDEKGQLIDGDGIIYICGRYMKECGQLPGNKVVTTVMSNFGLYKALDAVDIEYEKTKVGDKYVYENMRENGYRLGGEQSGHIIFKTYATTGDGILTAIKMMEVILEKKMTLSELAAPYVVYPQVLKNVRVTDKAAVSEDSEVQAVVQSVAEALGDNGRILVRESGTEPLIRVMVEAGEHALCEQYLDQVIAVIREKGYSV
jgi:phosphoglucosamine mutase